MSQVFVAGVFDDLRAPQVRFLEEASKLGPLCLYLRDDESAAALAGRAPKFGYAERAYFLSALRWVREVRPLGASCPPDALPGPFPPDSIWAVTDALGSAASPGEAASPAKEAFAARGGLTLRRIEALGGLACPALPEPSAPGPGRLRPVAMATGSFDWLHSGHLRFFEEAAAFGDLVLVVGHDENLRLLKGEGHPLVPGAERLYMAASVRFVSHARLSTGSGWLDAAPEIEALRPDRYVVNEDGDRPEKRAYCAERGIDYIVLSRRPRPGLPARSSTALRGF